MLRWLEPISEPATASLREGFADTLSTHDLAGTGMLRKTLVTTNPIESAIEIVKAMSRRAKRWNGSAMVMRRVGTGLVQAERQFRRVKVHRHMPMLIAALEKHSLQGSEVGAC